MISFFDELRCASVHPAVCDSYFVGMNHFSSVSDDARSYDNSTCGGQAGPLPNTHTHTRSETGVRSESLTEVVHDNSFQSCDSLQAEFTV